MSTNMGLETFTSDSGSTSACQPIPSSSSRDHQVPIEKFHGGKDQNDVLPLYLSRSRSSRSHTTQSQTQTHHAGVDSTLARSTSTSRGNHLSPILSRLTSRGTGTTGAGGRLRSQSSYSQDPEMPNGPRAPSPKPEEANAPPPEEEVTHVRLLAHYSSLVWSSMLGCLIRLGLNALGDYDGAVIFALAWSQGVGSGVMGFSLARKNEIIRIYPPIYTFLTTGIAGSITTFSSWMLAGYMTFGNYSGYNRGGFHDTVDGVAYSLSTFAIAMASLRFGEYLGRSIPPLPLWLFRPKEGRGRSANGDMIRMKEKERSSTSSNNNSNDGVEPNTNNDVTDGDGGTEVEDSSNPKPIGSGKVTPLLDILTIISAFTAYLIVLLLYFFAPTRHSSANYQWRHDVLFPLLLAPPGAMLRFSLSRINTYPPFVDRFPLGTFLVNMIATLILAGTYTASRSITPVGITRCDALYAIQQGFCGCASTVSTFAVEARSVRGLKWKLVYIGASVLFGHLFVLAILGGVNWDKGLGGVCTGSPI